MWIIFINIRSMLDGWCSIWTEWDKKCISGIRSFIYIIFFSFVINARRATTHDARTHRGHISVAIQVSSSSSHMQTNQIVEMEKITIFKTLEVRPMRRNRKSGFFQFSISKPLTHNLNTFWINKRSECNSHEIRNVPVLSTCTTVIYAFV